jgi:hypothetical protein
MSSGGVHLTDPFFTAAMRYLQSADPFGLGPARDDPARNRCFHQILH